jgi:hypothetical protein
MGDKDEGSDKTIAEDLVVTKYKMAAEITNSKWGGVAYGGEGRNVAGIDL